MSNKKDYQKNCFYWTISLCSNHLLVGHGMSIDRKPPAQVNVPSSHMRIFQTKPW